MNPRVSSTDPDDSKMLIDAFVGGAYDSMLLRQSPLTPSAFHGEGNRLSIQPNDHRLRDVELSPTMAMS